MQTAAPAGSIAASEATQRLCEGYFEFRALGPTAVKGLNAPVEVYEVVRDGPLRTHFQLAARRGLTKFVGREREMAAMVGTLERIVTSCSYIVEESWNVFMSLPKPHGVGNQVEGDAPAVSAGPALVVVPYAPVISDWNGRSRASEISGRLLAVTTWSSDTTSKAVVSPIGTGPTFHSTPKFEPSRLSSRNSG
jgi:hypothetical protein